MTLSTNQKIGVGFLILLGIGLLVWYFWPEAECDATRPGFDTKGQPSDKCKAVAPATTEVSPTGTQWVPESFPLRKGMWGDKVKILQQKLKIGADGKFGNQTEAAVRAKIGKTEVSEADYNNITNPPATGGGLNYATLKQALGTAAKNFSGGVYALQAGQNTIYRFDFYTNGRFIFSETGKTGYLKKGTYSNGGKKMVIDGGENYEEGTVFNNMQEIVKEHGN